MNHIGDFNKMVSEDHFPDTGKMVCDTPRTETYVLNPLPQVVSAEWARQLERELNVANARIKRLEEALRRIANQDYRGNRSTESQIAFEALKEVK